jgi:hypothetical protein
MVLEEYQRKLPEQQARMSRGMHISRDMRVSICEDLHKKGEAFLWRFSPAPV